MGACALRENADVAALFQNVDGLCDGFEIDLSAADGDRAEPAQYRGEGLEFEKLTFGEEIDLTLQIEREKENVVVADVVRADQAGTVHQLVFLSDDLHAEEKLIIWLYDDLQKTVELIDLFHTVSPASLALSRMMAMARSMTASKSPELSRKIASSAGIAGAISRVLS